MKYILRKRYSFGKKLGSFSAGADNGTKKYRLKAPKTSSSYAEYTVNRSWNIGKINRWKLLLNSYRTIQKLCKNLVKNFTRQAHRRKYSSQIFSLWLGDLVDSGGPMVRQPTTLCQSRLYPLSGTKNLASGLPQSNSLPTNTFRCLLYELHADCRWVGYKLHSREYAKTEPSTTSDIFRRG
jgi:hypothetical protein